MSRLLATCLAAALAAPLGIEAQPPRGGVALAHVDLNSADPDAAIAFWKDIVGAATYTRGSLNGVSMLGALIVITRKAPSGPSVGSAVDYLGLQVPDLQPFIDRLSKSAFKSFQPKPEGDVLVIDGPDGVRIELTADSSKYAPLEFGYIHFRTAQPSDTQAWYARHFGARPDQDDPHSSRLSGGTLTFAQADSAAPTVGRAIDHIAFEVKDLRSFSSALAADGVKLDSPFESGSSVFLTDPRGTRIELTESASH